MLHVLAMWLASSVFMTSKLYMFVVKIYLNFPAITIQIMEFQFLFTERDSKDTSCMHECSAGDATTQNSERSPEAGRIPSGTT